MTTAWTGGAESNLTNLKGPLSGVTVIDFTRVLAGPLATMNLADLGADVIKIERPGVGDDTRAWGPPWVGDDSTYYLSVNRNKSSVVLDLNDDVDVAFARELCATADVVAENFRPGYMAERGLGPVDLRGADPGLVYLSIEAFSGDGPAAALPGYDLTIQAMSGLMYITGSADGPPMKVGVALVDVITGLYATIATLAGLYRRAVTGEGCYTEVSLFDSAMAALANQASAAVLAGIDPIRAGNRHPSLAPYEVFEVSDGTIVVAAANDKTYRLTCEVIGRPDLIDDPRFVDGASRRANVDDLVAEIGAVLITDTRRAWLERLLAVGVPAGPINSISEAIAWSESMGLTPIVSDPNGDFRSIRSPVRIDGDVQSTCSPPPDLDQHGAEIRAAHPTNRPDIAEPPDPLIQVQAVPE